jgi:hypothetical protein
VSSAQSLFGCSNLGCKPGTLRRKVPGLHPRFEQPNLGARHTALLVANAKTVRGLTLLLARGPRCSPCRQEAFRNFPRFAEGLERLAARESQAYYRLTLAARNARQRNGIPSGLAAVCYENELKALLSANPPLFGSVLSSFALCRFSIDAGIQ